MRHPHRGRSSSSACVRRLPPRGRPPRMRVPDVSGGGFVFRFRGELVGIVERQGIALPARESRAFVMTTSGLSTSASDQPPSTTARPRPSTGGSADRPLGLRSRRTPEHRGCPPACRFGQNRQELGLSPSDRPCSGSWQGCDHRDRSGVHERIPFRTPPSPLQGDGAFDWVMKESRRRADRRRPPPRDAGS